MAEENKKQETEKKEESVKKEEKKAEEKGREFTIPLRRKFGKTARYKRTPKAIRAIKEFLVKHMKFYERDLNKVKLDKYLNEFVWARGIKNPPSKIKVRAFVDGEFIRAELTELSEKLRFKKSKMEKRESRAVSTKKKEPEKPKEEAGQTEEEKAEEKGKQAAVVEAGQKMEKAAAKKMKHEGKVSKQPKRQRRMALEK